jgi:glycerol-3-phosphate cytidylyltransferase
MGPVVGYVPGVFDLFHVGHLNVLTQARALCDVLVAGVVSDEVCEQLKGVPHAERIAIVDAIGIVDATYAEVTTDRRDAWRAVGFHRIVKGDDWRGTLRGDELERLASSVGAEVVYLPYTVQTSSTQLRRAIVAS